MPLHHVFECTVGFLFALYIRVNAISVGPIKTLSAKGIKDFNSILTIVEEKAPLHKNVTIEQVGNVSTFLLSKMSEAITGQVIYADNGFNIMV